MDTYEKKYKEIVGKIEKAYLYAQTDSTKAVLEEIFPELKESEDEKIRKALIKLVENIDGYLTLDGIDIEDVLDWLERQGEHANFRNKIQVGDKVTRNEDDVLVNLSQLKRVAKPADKVEPKFKVKYAGSEYNVFETKDIAGVTFYGIEDEPNHIDYVKADNCEIISGYDIKESGLSIPTKPVMFSWSEEDEDYYDAIIVKLEVTQDDAGLTDNQMNFLKSLRLQNHWKPTDE